MVKNSKKTPDLTKNCITSYSMITSGTELLQNTNKSLLLSSNSLTETNDCSVPTTSIEEKVSMIKNTKNENIPATSSICNTTSSYQTCTPATIYQTMPVLMPASVPHQPSVNVNDAPPSLRKETSSNDANNFYVSNAVMKNISQLNTIGDHTKILAPIREPINNTYTIGETVSTCMLVEKRHTVVSRVNMTGVNKQIVSSSNPAVTYADNISQTNLNQMTTCVENKPLNNHPTVITGTVPNQSVVISPSQTVQNTIPIVTNRTETFQNHSENIPQNVPTVATLTIPIAPPPQNGTGNRLLAGRLVIPVSLNCTGVKNVFPSSALVQNQPSVVNCNQQPVTIPGVIIVRNNNSNSKDINIGKSDTGKIILPSISSSKTKKITPFWKK